MERLSAVRLIIRGRVQGVGFRAAAVAEAARLGVFGWVRNLRDGSVEAFAEGAASAVEAFVAWCRHGPDGAHVLNVETTPQNPTSVKDFFIKR